LFFFFSSRRRHTRLQGDWSSDVCSSDLNGCPVSSGLTLGGDISAANPSYQFTFVAAAPATIAVGAGMRFFRRVHYRIYKETDNRSEERRVGKECRSRGSPKH